MKIIVMMCLSFRFRLLETPTKTPLVIIDLDISPEAKTLVQKNVKKDPKKPPPFCKQYQSASRFAAFFHDTDQKNPLPNFCIKGVVFNRSKCSTDSMRDDDEDMIEETQHNTSTTNSGTVTPEPSGDSPLDNLSLEGYHHNCVNACQMSEFILNLDQYGMDKDGCLPGMTRTPSPQPPPAHRTPASPSTQQIIRVDVTVNRDKQDHEKLRQVGVSSRPLVRDKRGKLKFNSSYNI